MSRIISLCLVVIFLLSLCACAGGEQYELTGQDVFGLPEQGVSFTLRHAGQSRLYLNFERGDRCAAYQSALRNLQLNKTNKKGSLDGNLYEICTDYAIYEYSGGQVDSSSYQVVYVKIIVNGDMVLYNDQWYEANTSQLLRQLERDFS